MNKNLYRIIFNQRRGQLMVVAESAASQGKAASGESVVSSGAGGMANPGGLLVTLRPACLAVLAALGMVAFAAGPAWAQVVADPNAPGKQRPTVLQTANGAPQINIQTPSAAGVSRNTYSQFDVQGDGAILNNSRVSTQTQTGGWVQGNPWLANGSARVILNEVNASNPSQLRGYIEVAGQRAEVIIANPAGVNVDGGGFINASRVTLTTGTPLINDGNLDGYMVQRGLVTIGGKGLDTSQSDYTAILARAAQINAGIWANELKVVTGANQIDARHDVGAAPAGAGPAPAFALDVAQLGGMYAGKITLIGTEAGIGARNAGTVAATAGNVVLQSNGWLSNSGNIQSGGEGSQTRLTVAGDVQNSGAMYAAGDTSIASQGKIANSGVIAAFNHTVLRADGAASRIDSAAGAVLASGLHPDNSLGAAGDLTVEASGGVGIHGIAVSAGNTRLSGSAVDLGGASLSGGQIAVTASQGDLDASRAEIGARAALSLSAAQWLRTDAAQVMAQQIHIAAHDLSNTGGQILQLGSEDLAIQLPGLLDNTSGRIAANSQNLTLGAATLSNTDGKIEHAGSGTLAIRAATLDDQRGQITGNGDLMLSADTLDHRNAASIAAHVGIDSGTLDNRGGSIVQTGTLHTTLSAARGLDNRLGTIESNGDVTLAAGVLQNAGGRIASGQNASVGIGSGMDNSNGVLAAGGNLTLAAGNVDNTGGQIQALGGDATLAIGDLNNSAGNVFAGTNLSTTAGSVSNSGSLYAAGRQSLQAGGAIVNSGAIAAGGRNTISAYRLDSGAAGLLGAGIQADGALNASGDLSVTTLQAASAFGQNMAAGNIVMSGASLDLSGSQSSAANIALTAGSGDVVTSHALLTTPGTLAIRANARDGQALLNSQGILSAGQLDLQLANLGNRQGAIIQTGAGDSAIDVRALDNAAGRIAVNSRNLAVSAATLDNTDGKIDHAGTGSLALAAANLYGQRGQITGNGALHIAAGYLDHRDASTIARQVTVEAATLDNRQGDITQLGNGQTSITASQRLDNSGGKIETNGDALIDAATLVNGHGRIAAGQNASVKASSSLDNSDGVIAASQNLTLDGGAVDNTRGSLHAVGGNATLAVGDLNNSAGSVFAGANLNTTASQVANSGSLYAAGNQTLNAGGAVSNSGVIAAQGNNTIAANSLSSGASSLIGAGIKADGSLQTAGELHITTVLGLGANGQNLAAGNASLSGGAVDLGGSQTSAANIALTAGSGDVSTSGAVVTTPGILAITARAQNGQSWVNRLGETSAGQLTVQAANLDNTQGSIVQTGGGDTALNLSAPAGTLDNSSGRIAVNSASLTLGAATLINTDGKIEHAGSGTLAIDAARLDGQRGQITSNGGLQITAGAIDHRNASTVAQQVTIASGTLDNRQGDITQLGNGLTSIQASLSLDNRAGSIASNGNTGIAAQTLNNQGGKLQAGGAASLDIGGSGTLDNSGAGDIAAGGNLVLSAGAILNQGGKITAGGSLNASAAQTLHNAGGLLAATGNVGVASATLDNSGGKLASVDGNLSAASGGLTVNDSGAIQAAGDITLNNGGLSNALAGGQDVAGSIAGRNVSIDSNGQALNNALGTIAATQALNLQSGALNNDGGLIQSGAGLVIDTHGQGLSNGDAAAYAATGAARNQGNAGGIVSGGSASLNLGNWNNSGGYVGAAGQIAGTAGQVGNGGGQIVGQSGLRLGIADMDNRNGQIQVVGDLALDAGAGGIDNRQGLIRSGATATLSAGAIDNSATLGSEQGIEGIDLALTTGALDNRLGALRADHNLAISSAGAVNNSQGLSSAGNVLSVRDDGASRSLAITNTGGTVIAGALTEIRAASLSGDGRILSQRDMALDLSGNYVQGADGEITANGNASLAIAGDLLNAGKLQAGGALTLGANNIDNSVSGDISAGITRISAAGVLNNRGVIDGADTGLHADTVNNLGTGRIYGGQLGIAAATLNNDAEDGVAATIAARENLNIGAHTIHNREHALIFSGKDLAIGGALDAAGLAIGSAAAVDNASATIEALGNLSLDAAQVNNLNTHFSVAMSAPSAPEHITEYQGSGSAQRYLAGTPGVSVYSDESLHLSTPDGTYEEWTQYDVARSTRQSEIVSSDPGRIIAGNDLSIHAGGVLNENSHLIAGGLLSLHGASLSNNATPGQKITSAAGTATSYWRIHHKGTDETGSSSTAYQPPDQIETISLSAGREEQLTAPQGSGTTLGNAASVSVTGGPSAAGSASANVNASAIVSVFAGLAGVGNASGQGAQSASGASGPDGTSRADGAGQAAGIGTLAGSAARVTGAGAAGPARLHGIVQVALAHPSGGAQVVRTGMASLQLPNASLFSIWPSPTANYLVVTDPRFANYREWSGSDYMLSQIQLDPSVTQKRLGDGFYEQSLIRDQVAQLTGQRFAGDYSSDDQQYRALMDAGVAYAKTWDLRPGVALTAAQMAALTSDIVWLVEQDVALADGSTQKALVPQVYLRLREGDLDGSGALLAGKEIHIDLSGDLSNSGSIAGRSVVKLDAGNVNNLGGRIHGDAVAVAAQNDLNNIGGTLSANRELVASAGRDLTIASTSSSTGSSAGGNSFSRTGIDRVAGLYITGEGAGGTLIAAAGRDVSLLAGVIGNAGQDGGTIVSAGRDINLGTLATASSNSLRWDANNYRQDSTSSEVGSRIQGSGSILLKAGNDLTARAADVQAGAALAAVAGHDIKLTAGVNQLTLDEGHQFTNSGFLHSELVSTRDTLERSSAAGSAFGGKTLDMAAGHDIEVSGSAILSDGAASLTAQHDIGIAAASDTSKESHQRSVVESGFLSGGGFGISYGTRTTSTEQARDAQLQSGQARSLVGSSGGDLTIRAGNGVNIAGSDIAAGGDLTLAGKSVTVAAGQDNEQGKLSSKMTQDGFTASLGGSAVEAIQTLQSLQQAAGDSKNKRVQAMAAATAAMAAKNAAAALAQNGPNVSISLTAGHSENQQTQTTASSVNSGSVLTAGRDLTITASGGGQASSINVVGSDLNAGNDVRLGADNQVNLLAAQDRESQHSQSSSMSAAAGVAANLGTNGVSFGFTASVSAGKGHDDGEGTTQLNSHVNAGRTLAIVSGGDTNLKGAVASAAQVSADIGGNLNLESLQDTARFDSKSQSLSASGTVGYGASFSASYNQSAIHNDYASVQEQSGIRAGDGGFQIKVGGNTDLKGAVISSTEAGAGSSSLETRTLTQSDIANHATTAADSVGVSGGASVAGSGANQHKLTDAGHGGGAGIGLPAVVALNESDASSTRSGIGAGRLVITDDDAQRAATGKGALDTVAGTKRDVATGVDGSGKIGNNLDRKEVQATLTVTAAFASAAAPLAAQMVGDAGQSRQDAAEREQAMNLALAEQARQNGDAQEAGRYQGLAEQAGAAAASWGDNGVNRLALHAAAQGLIGGLAGGNAGALGSVAGVGGGNLGQRLGKTLGEAEADKQKLTGQEREAFVNTYQQTLASLGGALGGLAAAGATGQGGIGALAGTVQGSSVATAVDVYNRQLHPNEKKRIANEIASKYAANHPGVTKEQAAKILEDQLLRQVDATAGAAGGWNQDASNYLTSYAAAYPGAVVGKDQWGNAVPLFGNASGSQRNDSTIFSANPQTATAPSNLGLQQVGDYLQGVGAGIQNVGIGIKDAALHPIDTLKGLWDTVTDPVGTGQKLQDGARTTIDQAYQNNFKPAGERVGEKIGGAVVGVGVGVGIGKIGGVLSDIKGANSGGLTGTVFDSIKATQSTYSGSVIPVSFEMALPNGQRVWVAGNATEHMVEFAQMKAVNYTPEAVSLASQQQLTSLQSAVNTATQNGVTYNQIMNVGGWELKFAQPRQPGQLPSLIHALPGK